MELENAKLQVALDAERQKVNLLQQEYSEAKLVCSLNSVFYFFHCQSGSAMLTNFLQERQLAMFLNHVMCVKNFQILQFTLSNFP